MDARTDGFSGVRVARRRWRTAGHDRAVAADLGRKCVPTADGMKMNGHACGNVGRDAAPGRWREPGREKAGQTLRHGVAIQSRRMSGWADSGWAGCEFGGVWIRRAAHARFRKPAARFSRSVLERVFVGYTRQVAVDLAIPCQTPEWHTFDAAAAFSGQPTAGLRIVAGCRPSPKIIGLRSGQRECHRFSIIGRPECAALWLRFCCRAGLPWTTASPGQPRDGWPPEAGRRPSAPRRRQVTGGRNA